MKKSPKKDMRKEYERRLGRCMDCPHVQPKAFRPYPRLWEYLTCGKAGEKILDIEVCWEEER